MAETFAGGEAREQSRPPAEAVDAGLAALALISGYCRIASDPAQLRHQRGGEGEVNSLHFNGVK